MGNLYCVLDISKDATNEEIKNAYVEKIREYPPEINPEGFKKIREAYEVLGNKCKRIEYDKEIAKENVEKSPLEIEIESLKNSSLIIKPIKDLVDLWRDERISEIERKRRFNNIVDILLNTKKADIFKSVWWLKRNYKEIYNLNPRYLENLLKWSEENSEKEEKSYEAPKEAKTSYGVESSVTGKTFLKVAVGVMGIIFVGGVIIALLPYIIGIGILIILAIAFFD